MVAALVLNSVMSQPEADTKRYSARPTFYNLPATIYSDSPYTEESGGPIPYCTLNYHLTSNACA